MMRKKLFGKNIQPDCSYCLNSVFENNTCRCIKGRSITDGKCKGFKYDPLMRVPRSAPALHEYTLNDFKL